MAAGAEARTAFALPYRGRALHRFRAGRTSPVPERNGRRLRDGVPVRCPPVGYLTSRTAPRAALVVIEA